MDYAELRDGLHRARLSLQVWLHTPEPDAEPRLEPFSALDRELAELQDVAMDAELHIKQAGFWKHEQVVGPVSCFGTLSTF
jgi:hypothetical protein